MQRNGNLKLSIALIVFAISAISVVSFLFHGSSNGQEKDVLISRGSSLKQVAEILGSEDIIRYPKVFEILLRLTKGNSRVRAGEFRFRYQMRSIEALNVLYRSDPIVHTITIPEGWTTRQIARLLASTRLVNENKFLELSLTPLGSKNHKVEATSLEGFLYPDTYTFSKIDGEERIIEKIVQRFFQKFGTEYKAEIDNSGFSLLELVTLASMVERETGSSEERNLIASVFHNRLQKKMRLQSDPTTIYGIKNFNGNLTKNDLKRPSPYNTYVIQGLPPGPIASPGLASLLAALRPATTEYLYFVSNNRGGHIFSKTYSEHNRHVQTHQRSLSLSRRPKK